MSIYYHAFEMQMWENKLVSKNDMNIFYKKIVKHFFIETQKKKEKHVEKNCEKSQLVK
jgi:hypothetical protein